MHEAPPPGAAGSGPLGQDFADYAPSPSGAGRGVSSLLNPPQARQDSMSYPLGPGAVLESQHPHPQQHRSLDYQPNLPRPSRADEASLHAGPEPAMGQGAQVQGPATGTIFGSAVNTYLSGGAFDPFLSSIGLGVDPGPDGALPFAGMGDVGVAQGGMGVGMGPLLGLSSGFTPPAAAALTDHTPRFGYAFFPPDAAGPAPPEPPVHRHSDPAAGRVFLSRAPQPHSLASQPQAPPDIEPGRSAGPVPMPPEDPSLPTHPRLSLPFQIEDLAAWEDVRVFLNLYMEKQHVLVPLVHKPTFAQDVLKRRDKGDEVFRGLLCSLVAYT